jgi:hypothetical protein
MILYLRTFHNLYVIWRNRTSVAGVASLNNENKSSKFQNASNVINANSSMIFVN